MDMLTKSLIGKHGGFVRVENRISKSVIVSCKIHDLHDLIMKEMGCKMGTKLLEMGTIISKGLTDDFDVLYEGKAYAFTEKNIEALVKDAYQAGLDAKNG
jgi:hypothetical protein